jgi:phage terminase large subunit-like protein
LTRPSERDRAAIYAHYGLTCPPRFATLRNFDNPTYGPRVAKISAKLGAPFNPWQRYVFDTGLEVDRSTGILVYRDIGCTVPRQSGKTTGILSLTAHRGMAWKRQQIVYAAQNGTEARKKWEDGWLPVLAAAGFIPGEGERLLPGHRARVRKANGREAVIWRKNQSIQGLHASTEQSGHGPTLHLGVKDEFFSQVDDRISAAWSPAMITVLMAQQWWFSTMGTSRSVPMNAAVQAGRELVESGAPSRVAYFDWSAPPRSDRTDPRVWLRCMPALCPDPVCRCSPAWRHTVTIPTIQTELDKAITPALLAEFDRAYLNQVREDDEVEADPNVPTIEAWNLLANDRAEGGEGLACAIDVTPSGDYAVISAVGEGPDGPDKPRGVMLEDGPGTAWVPAMAKELNARLRPVCWVIDDKGPAGELITPLANAGIRRPGSEDKRKRGDLWVPTVQELGACCASLTGRVKRGAFVHLGQAKVAEAVVGARTRSIGDGAFAFGRKASGANIAPLIAFAEALGGYERYAHLAVAYDPLDHIW